TEQGSLTVEGRFLENGIEILRHSVLPCVAAGVNAEVAEMAAAATKGQVHVDTHRRAVDRRLRDCRPGPLGACGVPEREGRIIADEVIAGGCLVLTLWGEFFHWARHGLTSTLSTSTS